MAGTGSRRRWVRSAPPRALRPEMEGLEERLLLYSTNGGQWRYPMLITYSIVPDGTSVGGYPSNLYATLNARFSQAAWQAAIQDAAAVWEAVASVNLVQVGDDGSPIGTSGDQQGDPRFGDIRIGGFSQSLSLLAFAFSPPPVNGGTDAGDIFFNTAQSWQLNGSAYDLETVAIHEFGHALGMSHSATAQADMYANYMSGHTAVGSDDIAGIDSVYSARRQDAFDQSASDNSASSAANLMPWLNSSKQIVMPGLDITGGSDVDWYKVQVPSGTNGTMTVVMQSLGLSSLRPRLQIYDASLNGLAQASSLNYGAIVSASVSGVSAGQWLYIKAFSATSTPSAGGTYGLEVNFGTQTMNPCTPLYTTTASQPDQGGGASGEGFNLLDLVFITIGTLTGFIERDTVMPDGPSAPAGPPSAAYQTIHPVVEMPAGTVPSPILFAGPMVTPSPDPWTNLALLFALEGRHKPHH